MQTTYYTRSILNLVKRQCTDEGCAEMPTSTWEKTGIPVLISLILFLAVFIVMFVIVRRRRIQNRKREEEAVGKIDMDDVEDRAAFSRQYGAKK